MAALPELLIAGLVIGSVYALFAVSLNVIWSMSGVVNLAHGEVVMLGAYAAFFLVHTGIPFAVGLVFLAVVTAVIAFAGYRALFAPLAEANLEYGSLLVTWGLSLIARASVREFVGTDFRSTDILREPVAVAGLQLPVAQFVVVGSALLVSLALAAFLQWTRLGRSLRAVAESPDLAASVGINVELTRGVAFVLGILLAVFAGVLLSTINVFYPEIGQLFILKGVAVVLVASLGRLWLTWCVGIGLGLLETAVQYLGNMQATDMIAYGLLIAALLLRQSELKHLLRRLTVRAHMPPAPAR